MTNGTARWNGAFSRQSVWIARFCPQRRKLRFPRLSIIADGFERHGTAIKRGLNPLH
jgi:hypothetical protein